MDATKLPKGQSPERHTDDRPVNRPGIYVHKDTGAKYITAEGEEGVIQADALMSPNWERAWEWTANVPSRVEILEMRKRQAEIETKKEKKTAIIEAPKKAEKLPVGGETYEPAVT